MSEANPTIRDTFYDSLNSTIEKTPNRDLLFIMGDFNAKTGSLHQDFPESIGRYGKGHGNSNGKRLAELCIQNDLFLANTMFQHKLVHRTTWSAPMRNYITKDGTERRNPIRNMIDYIITRINMKTIITNARSYGGLNTETDHKMVIAKVNIKGRRTYYKNTKKHTERIDTSNFKNKDLRTFQIPRRTTES